MSEQNNQCLLDGRYLTDYRPNSDVNNLNRAEYGVQNNFEYRMFLQQNAKNIMKNELEELDQYYGCGPFENTMLGEKTKKVCNTDGCTVEANDPNGLGQGRFYTNEKECIYKLKKRN